ncbi:hypothetical protein FH972_026181 [Carpinus fangiana]|uniref:Uncharacterized protein n=1 Tax=Carpinus fangiana TaxID=176857 RepID=A0A5N6L3R0_9ROSI|nr:hypothetical protein FH972_026181 [Carpinus fangiana]
MSRDRTMSSPGPGRPDEVASKVLRRARVSKMTRALQDRLALANIKINRGWQHRSMESLEPEIERELKRKRTEAQLDFYSDSSSNASGPFSAGMPSSSPLTSGPIFSDELPRSGSSHGSAKRFRMDPPALVPPSHPRTRSTIRPTRAISASWKSSYQLPESSPSFRKHSRLADAAQQNSSQYSETSTIMDDPSASEDDDEDIPIHSFQHINEPQISSSPPRTPPPAQSRSATLRANLFNSASTSTHQDNPYKEGAELLVQFAMSPSPGMPASRAEPFAPATPPAKGTPLPSSGMMHTPGTQLLWGTHGPNTPNTAFNFADFVNVTPSPAQGPWMRTPGTATARTPAAARETRRRLNFDSLMPPPSASSPNMLRSPAFSHTPRTMARRNEGLGMELGGMSRRAHSGTPGIHEFSSKLRKRTPELFKAHETSYQVECTTRYKLLSQFDSYPQHCKLRSNEHPEINHCLSRIIVQISNNSRPCRVTSQSKQSVTCIDGTAKSAIAEPVAIEDSDVLARGVGPWNEVRGDAIETGGDARRWWRWHRQNAASTSHTLVAWCGMSVWRMIGVVRGCPRNEGRRDY